MKPPLQNRKGSGDLRIFNTPTPSGDLETSQIECRWRHVRKMVPEIGLVALQSPHYLVTLQDVVRGWQPSRNHNTHPPSWPRFDIDIYRHLVRLGVKTNPIFYWVSGLVNGTWNIDEIDLMLWTGPSMLVSRTNQFKHHQTSVGSPEVPGLST